MEDIDKLIEQYNKGYYDALNELTEIFSVLVPVEGYTSKEILQIIDNLLKR